jgi:hypothetical protein
VVVVRKLAVGIAAAVVAGLVLGGVARLMMRLANLAAGGDTGFSLGGTLSIMVLFAVFTLPGAILAVLMRRRGRSALLVAAALFLCVPAASIAGSDLGHVEGLSTLQWVGVGMATAGVFASILAIPFLTLRLLAIAPGGRSRSRQPGPGEGADLATPTPI